MQAMLCDGCEKPITDMSHRVQVLVFTDEPIADPQIDLCADCGGDVIRSAKVKTAREKVNRRIRERMYAPQAPRPEIEGVDPETGTYTDVPPPPKAVVPGIDPRTGKGRRADGRPNEYHGEEG